MPSEREPVRFGIFEVNLETGEVRRAGVKVKLQEQPFQVLAALLEKPGEIVTKEELQERIWKDDTLSTSIAPWQRRSIRFASRWTIRPFAPGLSRPSPSAVIVSLGLTQTSQRRRQHLSKRRRRTGCA